MIKYLEELCRLNATSGNEESVRNYIIDKIKNVAEIKIDNSGNIIAFKKGKKSGKKVMVDAHMDEVGIIISGYTADGFLKFQTVGSILPATIFCKQVIINDSIKGVVGAKPIHLTKGEEGKKCPDINALYIDIGAKNRQEAEKIVPLGSFGVMASDFIRVDDNILSKALDDRIGCAVLIKLLENYNEYDFHATFTTSEEIGLRGAKTAAFNVDPEYAIILEGTTAADIDGVPEAKRVCSLGCGVAVSFMDNSTLYDKKIYEAAVNSGIKCQTKSYVSGGNNAGAIHTSKNGVKSITLSAPCRYIHSASSVADINDINAMYDLAIYMLDKMCSGEI